MENSTSMQTQSSQTIQNLINIVGKQHVLTEDKDTRLYRQGRRYGAGKYWLWLHRAHYLSNGMCCKRCDANCIVIMQAANTGLTGGSTPFGDDYDRPVVLISTRRLVGIQVINEGKQVICLPGATLDKLEKDLLPY
jgi:FAD/FMN-containing dehydrogenases